MSRQHDAAGIGGGRIVQRYTATTLALYGTVCWLCGEDGADSSDHVIPISRGGHPLDLANRRPAHGDCNRRRSDMTAEQWFARNPLPTRTPPAPSREW